MSVNPVVGWVIVLSFLPKMKKFLDMSSMQRQLAKRFLLETGKP
jgi:hypothetical protein